MLLSHSFFLRRIFLLGERRLFPVFIIGFLMVSELAFATGEPHLLTSFPLNDRALMPVDLRPAVTVMTFILVTFEGFASHMWMIWVMLANAVVIDILLTGCLIFFLWRSKTGFRRTDNLLDVLMVYSINTGLSTSLLTLPAMICSIVMPTNLLWSAIYVVASKMYANSLLAVLNSRRSLIDKGLEGFETGSFGLQVVDDREPRPFDLKAAPLPSPPMSLAGARGAGTHTHTHTRSNSNTLTNTLSNTLTNGSSSPSSVTVTHARPGAASLNQLKVADRVIGIQVTTETFVDIQPPRHIPCPYPSTSGGGVRTARPRPLPPIARRNGGGSGNGASLLGLGAPSDDPCDGSESV
ncbi:hypothetical protein GSI_05475 [Ganoderma sinense ZZ0214-1]|uniref:DUF6534 domain-containing protein n=1 Tax=Ganoderma sinense ZZ0214-1 TaxID=1077348 RepID=A0A2G8SEN8_9APHY|nr:hypothetical protein GSI_05475 [Ganoderma sinense ZZ0214-1]